MTKGKMLLTLGVALSIFAGSVSLAEEMTVQNQLIFSDQYAFENYTDFEVVKGNLKNSKIGLIDWKKEFKAEGIDTVEINTVFEDAIVQRGLVDKITFNYYGLYEITDQTKKPEIKVDFRNKKAAVFSSEWKEIEGYKHIMLTITLPDTYKEDIRIDTVSGDLNLLEGEFDEIIYDSVSGDIEIPKMVGRIIQMGTTSGDLDVDDVKVHEFDYESVSGDIDIEVLTVDDFMVDTTSGELEVYIKGEGGNLTFDSVSGDGDIYLDNVNNRAFEIDLLSGDIERDFNVSQVNSDEEHIFSGQNGDGRYEINIDSLSGDMNLEKKYIKE